MDYYFIESTVPAFVIFEKDVYFGDKWYASNEDFYTTRTYSWLMILQMQMSLLEDGALNSGLLNPILIN